MFKHLLVPIDGSDVTKKSLKNVLDLAKKDKASITLVYVSDPMPPMVYSDSNLGYGFSQKDHKKACDAIVMASHKRTGIKGVLVGSQTNEVIVHSSLPVIVLG